MDTETEVEEGKVVEEEDKVEEAGDKAEDEVIEAEDEVIEAEDKVEGSVVIKLEAIVEEGEKEVLVKVVTKTRVEQKRIGPWESTKSDDNVPVSIGFTGDLPGPKGDAKGVREPIKCFNLFFEDYYDELIHQSNLYASQQRVQTNPWTPTCITKEELLAFIGLNVAMGVVSLPSLNDYWATDVIISHPWFRSVMSRQRFREILRYIHVADNTQALSRNDPSYDKLWKVRPMMNFLLNKCIGLYSGQLRTGLRGRYMKIQDTLTKGV